MRTVVKKWGNSLAVRLPQHIAAELAIAEGAPVTLTVEDQSLVVRPARRRYKLADLLAETPKREGTREVDWGRPEGAEDW
jgi:antitoxin MazE